MKILAFETMCEVASVALYEDRTVHQTVLSSEKRHAQSVLPAAEELLRAHGYTTADMDAFAVDIGPGSFTGIRIGVCLANALGLAHHKPVIGVNSLEALAEPFRTSDAPVCALYDARNGNGYGAVYQKGVCIVPPTACEVAPFLAALPENCTVIGTVTEDNSCPSAASVAILAVEREGEKQVSPMYLRPSQAERMHPQC